MLMEGKAACYTQMCCRVITAIFFKFLPPILCPFSIFSCFLSHSFVALTAVVLLAQRLMHSSGGGCNQACFSSNSLKYWEHQLASAWMTFLLLRRREVIRERLNIISSQSCGMGMLQMQERHWYLGVHVLSPLTHPVDCLWGLWEVAWSVNSDPIFLFARAKGVTDLFWKHFSTFFM